MRTLLYVSLLLALASCSNSFNVKDIAFYDSYGKEYQLRISQKTIKKEYGLNKKPKIIIIATSSNNTRIFKEQMSIIHNIDAEKMSYMYVVANSNEEDRSGYYTDPSTALRILSGEEFRIIIFSEDVRPVADSSQILSVGNIIDHLTKSSSGR